MVMRYVKEDLFDEGAYENLKKLKLTWKIA